MSNLGSSDDKFGTFWGFQGPPGCAYAYANPPPLSMAIPEAPYFSVNFLMHWLVHSEPGAQHGHVSATWPTHVHPVSDIVHMSTWPGRVWSCNCEKTVTNKSKNDFPTPNAEIHVWCVGNFQNPPPYTSLMKVVKNLFLCRKLQINIDRH